MGVLLQYLLTFVLLYKYVAIFLITFIGALAIPIPASSVLIASGFFVTQGYLDMSYVFLAGLLGNIAGDNAAYWLARRYGETAFKKIGLKRFLKSSSFEGLENRLTRHPVITIFFSRFVTALTPAVNVLSGLAKLRYGKFLAIEAIGEAIDVAIMCACGFIFGDNWEYLEKTVGTFTIIVIIVVVLVILAVWRKLARNRNGTKEDKAK